MGSLTVHVLDENQDPIAGKKVYCEFPGSFVGIFPTNSECYTDGDGVAEFDDVPVCTVQVYVGGELQVEVGVGTNDYEDVTVTV